MKQLLIVYPSGLSQSVSQSDIHVKVYQVNVTDGSPTVHNLPNLEVDSSIGAAQELFSLFPFHDFVEPYGSEHAHEHVRSCSRHVKLMSCRAYDETPVP